MTATKRMGREPVIIEKRRPLTRKESLHLSIAQLGRCGCGCGRWLDPRGELVIDEHIIPLAQGGSNDLPNRALYRKPCSDEKNKRDATDTAKCKRLAEETCTGPSRPIPQRVNPWPPKGSQKLQGRSSFDKSRPRTQDEQR